MYNGFQPPINGFRGFTSPMAPISGPYFGGLPIIGRPVAVPPPANFHGGQFGGPAQGFPPMQAQQANFQPQPNRRIFRVFPQDAPQVQAELGYQRSNDVPAPSESYIARQLAPLNIGLSDPINQAFARSLRDYGGNVADHLPSGQVNTSRGGPSYQGAQSQPQGPLDSGETQRKNLYSISYFPSSDPLAQNASPQIANRPSKTSIIFHEYRSASLRDGVSPADFIANFYGNGDSNSVGSPLVKICKMELAEDIKIGDCVIYGRQNYIDINEGGNKTRIHINNEGARDLENYRILVRREVEKYKMYIDFNSLNQDGFKDLKNVNDINTFFSSQQPVGGQVTNDDKTLDAIADTFISNNLKAGRFKTEIGQAGVGLQDKPFAYVKIERPKDDENKINVTVSDVYSAELNSININAGKNNNNEEVFFQLSVEAKDGKQVIAQDSLKYFTKNGNGEFKPEEDVKKGWVWGLKNKNKLGDAKDKIINIYTHKEQDDEPTLKYEIKGGKFVKTLLGGDKTDSTSERTHKHQKVKCGELNDFTDHEFMNPQSRSASPQAGARGGPQSPDHVAGGGAAVGQSVVSSPMPMMGVPAPAPIMGGGQQVPMMGAQSPMVAPMSPHPAPFQGGMPMMGQMPIMAAPGPMMMGGGRQAPIYAGSPPAPAPMMGVPVQMRAPMGAPGQMPMMVGGPFPVVQQVPMGGGIPVRARAQPPMVMMPAGGPNFHFNPSGGAIPMQPVPGVYRGSA